MNWKKAEEYCGKLTESGEWRLPSIKELVYLGDIKRSGTTIDTEYFDIKNSWYWSDTIFKGDLKKAWTLNLSSSSELISKKEDLKNVICVQK